MEEKRFETKEELFREMFTLSIKNVEGFFAADVLPDVDGIKNAVHNHPDAYLAFYWVVRKHGTHLYTTAFKAAQCAHEWSNEYIFTAKILKDDNCFIFRIIDNVK